MKCILDELKFNINIFHIIILQFITFVTLTELYKWDLAIFRAWRRCPVEVIYALDEVKFCLNLFFIIIIQFMPLVTFTNLYKWDLAIFGVIFGPKKMSCRSQIYNWCLEILHEPPYDQYSLCASMRNHITSKKVHFLAKIVTFLQFSGT